MMDKKTGVVLIHVDTQNNVYSRYEGCAGRTVKLSNAWKAERPLTQDEVEVLRKAPERLTEDTDPEPKVA